MDRIPEPLRNRMTELQAQQELSVVREGERLEREAKDYALDQAANVEALELSRQYAALLDAAGAQKVKIYDNFPKIRVSSARMLGNTHTFANGSEKTASDDRISHMLEPTGEGWIIGNGKESDSEYDYYWSYAIDTNGEILSDFYHQVSAGNLLKGREQVLGVGVYSPDRLYGRKALAAANDHKLLDGVAMILGGKPPELHYYTALR